MAAVAAVLAVVTTVLWAAPAPMMAPWDTLVLLDGGYRIFEGQVPGTDFENPVGPLTYGLVALGMSLHGVSLGAVARGNTVMVLACSGLTWYATRGRMRPAWRVCAVVYAAVLVSAVRPLGYSPTITTYAMLYNRYGWVLFTLTVILVLVQPSSPRRMWLEHLVLGVVLGLALYTKVTFALGSAAVVLVGLVRQTGLSRARRLLALMAGLAVVVVTLALLLRVDPLAYLGDVADAAQVQTKGRLGQIAAGVVWSSPAWTLTLAVLVVLLRRARRVGTPTRPVWALATTCGAVVLATILLGAGDAAEKSDLVALVVLPLLVTSSVPWKQHGRTRWMRVTLALLLLGTAGTILTKDLVALGDDVAHRSYVHHAPASQQITSANLQDFVVPGESGWSTAYATAHDVPSMINDGIAMIRRHATTSQRVVTLGFGSPFNVALGLRPTKGGLLWYDLGFDLDRQHHPSAEEALGQADFVMIPQVRPQRGCCQETVLVLRDIYAPYLGTHFRQVDVSDNWTLLQRTA